MNNDKTFGLKLKQLRKAKGLTQAQLAELAGLNEKHISKLELGIYKPNFDTLKRVLTTLNVSVEDVGIDLENVSINDNPFYIKSLQILNNADDKEIEFFYSLLKVAKLGTEILK